MKSTPRRKISLFSKTFLLIYIFLCTASLFSYSIDYDNPEKYQLCGDQTRIENQAFIEEIKNQFPHFENSLDQLKNVRRWIKKSFTYENNFGETIGQCTVDQLYQLKVWRGCHDIAHLFAATIRKIGYPCVLVETTSIRWSLAYHQDASSAGPAQGHNYAEVFVKGKWILFDPMSPAYLENHDPYNLVIPPLFDSQKGKLFYENEPNGFYVMTKGIDCWEYGIKSATDLLFLQKTVIEKVVANSCKTL